MENTLDIKKLFLSHFADFENSLNGGKAKPVHELRRSAISKFSELQFPTTRDEEWKYTNISPLLKHDFVPVQKSAEDYEFEVNHFLFDKMEHSLIVFINGMYSSGLSKIKDLPKGVVVKSLSEAIKEDNPIVKRHLGQYADFKNHIFTSLSAAFVQDGAFIYIPDGKVVEDPIHILFLTISDNQKILVQPRNLFVAGKNSQFTIIEHFASTSDEDIYFTNSVTEIVTEENAFVDHLKVQEESKKAFHIGRMDVHQERNSNFVSHLISFGAAISRNDFNSRFNDDGGESMLNGLFLIEGTQLFDAHTLIDHAKPHCNSHEHYKGILMGSSRGVFNGKVIVRKNAQKTNAFQENNNIILSDDALVNTKPQLEIFANDVKCSHGATIGQLDNDAMFYLKTRGIGVDRAKAILIHAFASDVVRYIKVNAVREYIESILKKKFHEDQS
ncbi:MAG: Fe-S cluster assembly protein SufD [Ignavibacteria bacterium RIFOXYB2_FULL_35_12]|nr:MAG: Fe-S cluster assembly protein SufD [Ignavibacteria bacterium GWA2_36_19]OGU62641.1 MAG: Fe-S cluster assembly protein SufD [Ignavibacteria bacterium GWF2_35_20]OGU88922.1 MAG: Fe-S cluster assembly protein SufD [Ignavibacteria bacterium RIFOXYC12_FULL_35_11]OGU89554.1 MAG: Fe-S cluster assembly protein SufD [Ignavibacteria bacterium RIFOXYA12_FULL_35_25]OGU94622.1 MAG: Fe-S cluster assembly protein SufD [Ignavibacteria bacterium RIFOXYB12_FULL_35_14]OGV01610.1 MAG: Fe-S cluster assembl